eukprot:768556-Hanusia_phi.AAC.1
MEKLMKGKGERKVDMRGCFFSREQLQAVYLSMAKVGGHRALDLRCCCIGDDGCEDLSRTLLLRENDLTWLDLGQNGITKTSLPTLLKGIEFSRNLEYVDLRENDIDDAGVKMVKDFLSQHPRCTNDRKRVIEINSPSTDRRRPTSSPLTKRKRARDEPSRAAETLTEQQVMRESRNDKEGESCSSGWESVNSDDDSWENPSWAQGTCLYLLPLESECNGLKSFTSDLEVKKVVIRRKLKCSLQVYLSCGGKIASDMQECTHVVLPAGPAVFDTMC